MFPIIKKSGWLLLLCMSAALAKNPDSGKNDQQDVQKEMEMGNAYSVAQYEKALSTLSPENLATFLASVGKSMENQRLDGSTVLAKIEAKKDILVYHYRLNNTKEVNLEQFDSSAKKIFTSLLETQGAETMCQSNFIQAAFKRGIKVQYRYSLNNKPYLTLSFDRKSCDKK